MPKKIEVVDYFLDNLSFKGYLVYPDTIQKKRPAILPAILVGPTWMGLNPFFQAIFELLADLGYIAFGVDFFGDGGVASNPEEAKSWIAPLMEDRQILRDRLYAALNYIRTHPLVDRDKIAGVGYCFGGRAMLELAKSGAHISGVVSIHGVLGNPLELPCKPIKTATQIPASVLLLHGYKDAMVPEEDLLSLERELSLRGVDWQVVVYGDAMHAFTNPAADMPELSLQYHEKSAQRAWKTTRTFLEELFEPL